MIKRIFITLLLAIGCNVVATANDTDKSYKEITYNLFINNNIQDWDSVILEMQSDVEQQSIESKMELLGYYYGYIGYLLDKKQKEKAAKYIKMSEALMSEMEKLPNPQTALFNGYKANITGFKIALSPIKATLLARGMLNNTKSAEKLGADNPIIDILVGNISYYMPEVFGGDKNRSLALYRKSLNVLNSKPELRENNWMYLQLMATIGLAEEALGNNEAAKIMYEEVLRQYPNYKHVKDYKYPNLLKKLGNQ